MGTSLVPSERGSFLVASDNAAASGLVRSLSAGLLDPNAITRQMALALVPLGLPSDYENRLRFINGDHWQWGTGWSGPRPVVGDPQEGVSWAEIERVFKSQNVLRTLCNRHRNSLLAREPKWRLVPKAGRTPAKTVVAEAEAALSAWWDSDVAAIHAVLLDWAFNMLWASRAPLRFLVPTAMRAEAANAESYADTMQSIFLEAPSPHMATVYLDPETKRQVGALHYTRPLNLGMAPTVDTVELSFLDPARRLTVTRSINIDGTVDSGVANLNRHITMFEGRRYPLVTPQTMQLQRGLNLALTMIERNIVAAGFPETFFLNIMAPGRWETDGEGKITGRYIPEPMKRGAGVAHAVSGLAYDDQDGKTVVKDPSVVRLPAEPVTGPKDAADAMNLRMHEETHQQFALTQAGIRITPEQQRGDYEDDLNVTASVVNRGGRWMLETALALAEALRGEPGRYTDELRAEFGCDVNSGPLTAVERDSLIRAYEKSVLSLETVQQQIGVQDVDAENARIASQPGEAIDLTARQANAGVLYRQMGMAMEPALEAIGHSPADAARMAKGSRDIIQAKPETPTNPQGAGRASGQPNPPARQGRTKTTDLNTAGPNASAATGETGRGA